MIGIDRVHRWLAVTISAALIGAAAAIAHDGSFALAGRAPASDLTLFAMRTQADDQPQVEQVGEGDAEDPETLDEGAPPAQEGEDVELLDQGAPQATAAAPPDSAAPPAETAAAPAATAAPPSDAGAVYTAPEASKPTGPVLPAGFGSGRVRASAGGTGFPVGLAECHVGVVTGRAYVGIDCGEDGDRVGHARSFEDFPFVLEAEFPFESDDAFFSDPFFTGRDSDDAADDSDVVASARRQTRNNANSNANSSEDANDGNTAENVVVTGIGTGNAAVELAQKERDRGPRVRVGKDQSTQTTKRQKAKNDNASSTSAKSEADSDDKAKNQNRSKGKKQQAAKADKSSKGKKSKDGKKREKRRERKK